MRCLAFDLGYASCGWALVEAANASPPALLSCGAITTSPKRREGERWRRLLSGMLQRARDESPDLLAYEEVLYHQGRTKSGELRQNWIAAHRYGGCEALLWIVAERVGLEVAKIGVAAPKKLALGKGGGKGTGKDEMIAAARERWPHVDIATSDAADAAWIGSAVLHRLGHVGMPGDQHSLI